MEDLSALAPDHREREVRGRFRRSAGTRFDLEHCPLFRAELLRTGEARAGLLAGVEMVVKRSAWPTAGGILAGAFGVLLPRG